MTFLYFGYGSNMLPSRLQARCPSAQLIGKANAIGFAIEFWKRSIDESGNATLIEVEGALTRGALFEIDMSDLGRLDDAEGPGYERVNIDIAASDDVLTAKAYVSSSIDRQLKPYDWYLALILAGAEYHKFDEHYLAGLRGTLCRESPADLLGEGESDNRADGAVDEVAIRGVCSSL